MQEKIDWNLSVTPVTSWEELRTAIADAPDGAIIGVMQNMEATTSTITIPTGKTVTLAAYKGEVVISRAFPSGHLFEVQTGSGLILGDSRGGTLVFDGNGISLLSTYTYFVTSSGDLTMNVGAELRNNKSYAMVCTTGGTFTMHGGGIHGSTTNGVYVVSGTFTMHDGSIYGNSDSGVVVSGGTFTMNGGSIHGNTQNGVAMTTGGSGGTFIMNDGSIYGNTHDGGGGSGTFTMNGGSIHGSTSYGVYIGGTFTMTGGSIHDNTNCGVYVAMDSTFTMTDGSIYNNVASTGDGGGVTVSMGGMMTPGGAFTMTGGSIYNNVANSGGGVSVGGGSVGSSFTMHGGSIFNNEVSYNGGGVSVGANCTFTMDGGCIYNNVANSLGGGVYVFGTFTMVPPVTQLGNIYGNTPNQVYP
jgi:hypothetical protein